MKSETLNNNTCTCSGSYMCGDCKLECNSNCASLCEKHYCYTENNNCDNCDDNYSCCSDCSCHIYECENWDDYSDCSDCSDSSNYMHVYECEKCISRIYKNKGLYNENLDNENIDFEYDNYHKYQIEREFDLENSYCIQRHLDSGEDPNYCNELYGDEPVLIAIAKVLYVPYNFEIIQTLLENGANPNICDNEGKSILEYAIELLINKLEHIQTNPRVYDPKILKNINFGTDPTEKIIVNFILLLLNHGASTSSINQNLINKLGESFNPIDYDNVLQLTNTILYQRELQLYDL